MYFENIHHMNEETMTSVYVYLDFRFFMKERADSIQMLSLTDVCY